MDMRKKLPVPFERKFPNADPLALRLLQRLLAFDPKDRPTAQEVSFYLAWHILCPIQRESFGGYFKIFIYIFLQHEFERTHSLFGWQALSDPFFKGLARIEREPSSQPISRMEFEFERRRVSKDDIKELIYREILEYHPQLLKDYKNGTEGTSFMYPRSA